MSDEINQPQHYTQWIECADFIESQNMGFFDGNAVKYITRYRHKGTPVKDLQKAKWYIERLIKQESKGAEEFSPGIVRCSKCLGVQFLKQGTDLVCLKCNELN